MVREKALSDERTALASLLNVYNKQTDILNEMLYVLDAFKKESERYLEGENFNPMVVSNYAMYGAKLQNDIKVQKDLIQKTEIALKHQQEVVKQAYIKVKSLENLKDRQKEQYLKELQSEEIKQIDDIVNSRRNIA
ncbi:flagellar FliJ family protein [bacterium]|nr:flagellar FliJ family protein [bacterium]